MSFRSTLEHNNTLSEICQLLFSIFQKLIFVIQHAVAIALEIGIGDLLPELLADTLILLRPLQTAGAVAAGALQTILDDLDHFLVFVQFYSHGDSSFPMQVCSLSIAEYRRKNKYHSDSFIEMRLKI